MSDDLKPEDKDIAARPDGGLSRRSVLVTGATLAAASLALPAMAGGREAQAATAAKAAELDRTVLPVSRPAFAGKIGENYKDSTPDWSPVLPVQAPEGAPNVLIVVLDDVGYGHLGCYGGPIETPNLDKVASQGIRYTDFHTTALCSPTRAPRSSPAAITIRSASPRSPRARPAFPPVSAASPRAPPPSPRS
jgi:hypothetical protein